VTAPSPSVADPRADEPQDSSGELSTRSPGERFDLPERGVGSVSSMGRRLVGLLVDCVLASLVTSLFVHPHFMQPETMQTLNYWSVLTWFVITVIATSFFAATPGMVLAGIRVARLDGRPVLLPGRAIFRAVLVAVILPAVVWDVDHRGLQDKVAGTIVLTTR
jgi:uncharacterized RDD family membrane protein YckC